MTKELKDTVEVAVANASALGLTLTQANDILQFISLTLAIAFTVWKFSRGYKKNEKDK
tara:strand:- start:3981 stop:4154 length:174 start_codon:yes stop_codon:yes gene_type:complete